ncbi:MAG: VOC family protein [Rhizobiales bacterium]|nr:VOC family protein [Hyphomicrobiales bacterium]
MTAKLIHSMIRVMDEEKSTNFYKQAFGLDVFERFDFEDFVLIYLKNNQSNFELELTVNKSQTEPYDLGNGYGHIAVVVDDVEAEHQRLTKLNLNPQNLVEFNSHPTLKAKFFFVTDPDGYKIEILQKMGRFQ